MNENDSELLRQFVWNGSEAAFAELLRRHVDLVYSASLRQLGADPCAAEEVTQTVFTDLARKAKKLTEHPTLTGWLYTSTRLVAAQHRRTESRRRVRETAAHAHFQMLTTDTPDPDWNQLRPVLDEAMHELGEPDREAVLLRYFEKRPLADIGTHLGLSENAARMRVERALDRLHGALSRRGITSTAAALGVVLGAHAVLAAPAGLVERVRSAALLKSGVGGGGSSFSAPLILGSLALVLMLVGLVWMGGGRGNGGVGRNSDLAVVRAGGGVVGVVGTVGEVAETRSEEGEGGEAVKSDAALVGEGAAEREITLKYFAKDSGAPVPGVVVNYFGWQNQTLHRRSFLGTRDGEVTVRLVRGTTMDEMTSAVEGFADTRLRWSSERGGTIPARYAVRLERAALIGGRVEDPDGRPIAGAKVGWNAEKDDSEPIGVESLNFGWIEVETDMEGRWKIHRIAESAVRTIYGGATHAELQPSRFVFVREDKKAEQELRQQSHVFRLGSAGSLFGVVVNGEGESVMDARVAVGPRGTVGSRETRSGVDGEFALIGTPMGPTPVTVQAKGYAAKTVTVDLGKTNALLRFELESATPLRLRVINRAGAPVKAANVWLTLSRGGGGPELRASFHGRSDVEGRVVWAGAPAGEHTFDIAAAGYFRTNQVMIPADGEEHTVTLAPALVIFGKITDSSTGERVPKFRMTLGWPGQNYAHFSSLDRFSMNFFGGEYRHSLEEEVIAGANDPRCVLRFEADGYSTHVTRPIAYGEGEVRLDVALEKAAELEIRVVDPLGRPAAGAGVGLVFPGAGLKLGLDGLSQGRYEQSRSMRRVEADGTLKLTKEPRASRVLVAHPSGYVETSFLALEEDPVVRLRPWGRIEGEFRGARSVRVISLAPVGVEFSDLAYDFSVQTDASGKFLFERAPTGRQEVNHTVVSDYGNGTTASQSGHSETVEVVPGETVRVTLGGGYRVTGNVRFPPGFVAPVGAHWITDFRTPLPEPPREIQLDRAALEQWLQNPQVQAQLRRAQSAPVSIQPDGTFVVETIRAGEYRLNLVLLSELGRASGVAQAPKALLSVTQRVRIPEEPVEGEIHLGELMPAAGDPAP